MVRKKTIAIDIDDVLAANAENFVEFSNKKWGTHLRPDDYTEHWAEMWKVDMEEVEKRRDIIITEKVFIKHKAFEEAKAVLKKLAKNYKLVIVSSRGPRVQADTIEWVHQNFKGIFSEVHFAKIWDRPMPILEQLKMTKAEICSEIGADYLIDDQPKHCIAAAEAGITTLLFGDYRWTKVNNLSKSIIKVKNWQEVLEYFDGQNR
ncbi:HAD family hydrolase [Candidatus Saccharibacteria bacterium]|nr:HAD family hydrolase [Candidatus Saccharibacteria bacterium]